MDQQLVRQITEFVFARPRTVQEIAHLIQKNWRTADRYVAHIASETGTIATRTFRGGTRGALKVVYANALPSKGSAYQERLLQEIVQGRRKENFSPFDIYQFVSPEKRNSFLETNEQSKKCVNDFNSMLQNAKRQILFFSGNMSWMEGAKMRKQLEKLARDKISMKVLTRIDITSKKKVEQMLAFNQHAGWDAVEIRHCEQPLRAVLIDDSLVSIKEVLSPEHYKPGELKHKTFIFYKVKDQEWISWMQKVFWHLFRQSVDAKMRLTTMTSIKDNNMRNL